MTTSRRHRFLLWVGVKITSLFVRRSCMWTWEDEGLLPGGCSLLPPGMLKLAVELTTMSV